MEGLVQGGAYQQEGWQRRTPGVRLPTSRTGFREEGADACASGGAQAVTRRAGDGARHHRPGGEAAVDLYPLRHTGAAPSSNSPLNDDHAVLRGKKGAVSRQPGYPPVTCGT